MKLVLTVKISLMSQIKDWLSSNQNGSFSWPAELSITHNSLQNYDISTFSFESQRLPADAIFEMAGNLSPSARRVKYFCISLLNWPQVQVYLLVDLPFSALVQHHAACSLSRSWTCGWPQLNSHQWSKGHMIKACWMSSRVLGALL